MTKIDKIILITIASSTLILLFIINYINYHLLINEINNIQYHIDYKALKIEPQYLTAKMTMYNAGVPAQTDNSPCISASNDNICELIAEGTNVCATNFLPLGTQLRIKGLGDCIVLDRMAKRFSTYIDWAMPADKIKEATNWGVKTVEYQILQ